MRSSVYLMVYGTLFLLWTGFKCIEPCIDTPVSFRHSAWTLALLDNSGAEPLERTGTTFPRRAFGIRIDAQRSLVNPQDTAGVTCPLFVPDSAIVDARVLATADFDAQHPAGSDVSAFFKIRFKNGVAPASHLSKSFINYQPLELIGALLNQYEFTTPADLLLVSPPEKPYTGAFEVQLLRSDSSKITITTNVVILKD